jgi:hypothetical protein
MGRKTRRAFAGATAAVLAALWGGAQAQAAVNPVRMTDLGVQAYVYGLPLMEFLRVRETMTSIPCADAEGNAPVNAFSHADGFSGPENRTIVAPNVDTLYSIAHLDLGDGPVVLGHPDMGSRYFVFQLLDPYTNTVAYVGSRTTGSKAGRFAITWTGAPGAAPEGTTPITVEHRRIWIIGRTLAGDRADQLAANGLMRQYRLTPPGGVPAVADCDDPNFKPAAARRPAGLAFLDGLSAAMEDNPPPARDAAFLRRLAPIGVGPGRRVVQARLNPLSRTALDRAVRQVDRAMPSLADAVQIGRAVRGRGWTTTPANIGDYGTDYLIRAGVAQIGLGANTPEEALYRTALFDSRGRALDGRRSSYRLRFRPGQEPPNDAFWSLTVYDDDGFLVDAPEGRYAVGSSRPPLARRADGSVEIVFSRTRPADPQANWLPVPAQRFRAYLRIYAPRSAALTGAWRPPPIERLRG